MCLQEALTNGVEMENGMYWRKAALAAAGSVAVLAAARHAQPYATIVVFALKRAKAEQELRKKLQTGLFEKLEAIADDDSLRLRVAEIRSEWEHGAAKLGLTPADARLIWASAVHDALRAGDAVRLV